jgi:hypothetical protein
MRVRLTDVSNNTGHDFYRDYSAVNVTDQL